MKLTDLLRRRSELARRSESLAAQAAEVSDELAKVDAELFARMKNLVVAIEGPEPPEAHPTVLALDAQRSSGPPVFFQSSMRMRATTPRMSKLEPHIISVLADADRPMSRNEIFDAMVARNIQIPGKNPKSNLSAHLSYADSVVRDAEGRWTLKQKELA